MYTLLGHTMNMSISLFYNKINEPSLQRVNVFRGLQKVKNDDFVTWWRSQNIKKRPYFDDSGVWTLCEIKSVALLMNFSLILYIQSWSKSDILSEMTLRGGVSDSCRKRVLAGQSGHPSSVYADKRGISQLSWRLPARSVAPGVGLGQVRL